MANEKKSKNQTQKAPVKVKQYVVNWHIGGAGDLEPGKAYTRGAFDVNDSQFSELLQNGTISEK